MLMAAALTDFRQPNANASTMDRAQATAQGLKVSNLTLRTETFADSLQGLKPGFGYLAGLGLLSWFSPENRALPARIAGRVLRPGGAAAFGYNTLPGRGPELLAQRMIQDHPRVQDGLRPEAIQTALGLVQPLFETAASELHACSTLPKFIGLWTGRCSAIPDPRCGCRAGQADLIRQF